MRYRPLLSASAVLIVAAWASAQDLKPSNLSQLQTLIKPQTGEANWRDVEWMAGEPLGTC
jgi:hypothetical protein